MKFEWDDEKAQASVEKHGISFGEATEVFYDPNALIGEDQAREPTPTERKSYEERER